MASFAQVIVLFSAVGTSISTVNCSAEVGASCFDEDATSLIQTKSSVRLPPGLNLEKCHIDTKLAMSVVKLLAVKTIGKQASWNGDWQFMVKDECARRGLNMICKNRAKDECSGECQWYPQEKVFLFGSNICKSLKVQQLIDYAQATPESPFGVYTATVKECNRRSEQDCTGQCTYDERKPFAACTPTKEFFEKAICSKPWQLFLKRVEACSSASTEACAEQGCQIDSKTSKCGVTSKEFDEMGYGYIEGNAVREDAFMIKKDTPPHNRPPHPGDWDTEKVINVRCGNGEWRDRCRAVMRQSGKCLYQTKPGECNGDCELGVFIKGKCDNSYAFLDKACSGELTGEAVFKHAQAANLDGSTANLMEQSAEAVWLDVEFSRVYNKEYAKFTEGDSFLAGLEGF